MAISLCRMRFAHLRNIYRYNIAHLIIYNIAHLRNIYIPLIYFQNQILFSSLNATTCLLLNEYAASISYEMRSAWQLIYLSTTY